MVKQDAGERSRVQVLVVGAGPIGIEVAAALKADGVDVLILEAGCIGATMAWWAPGTQYFSSPERISIAGVPLVTADQRKATREDYLAYLRQVVDTHGLRVRTNTRVVGMERRGGGGFVVRTRPSAHGVGGAAECADEASLDADGATYESDRVVLAIGNMHRPRLLGIEGEDHPFVSHFLDDPHVYHGQRVLIVGGKNSAVEAAIRLYRVGAEVTMSYRGDAFDKDRIKYWLLPELEWLISKGRIGFLPESTVAELRSGPGGEAGQVVASIERAGTAADELAFDRVLLLTGYAQDQSLLEMAGVAFAPGPERRPMVDRRTLEASGVPGLYVAGTACGGSQQRARLFIENCHVHAERIAAAVQGRVSEALEPVFELEES